MQFRLKTWLTWMADRNYQTGALRCFPAIYSGNFFTGILKTGRLQALHTIHRVCYDILIFGFPPELQRSVTLWRNNSSSRWHVPLSITEFHMQTLLTTAKTSKLYTQCARWFW